MKASVSAAPFGDVTVTLKATPYNASVKNAVNPSANITVTKGSDTVAFSTSANEGYLMFSCGTAIGASSTLTYAISGTDKASYTLSGDTCTVSSVAKTKELTKAVVEWKLSADTSSVPKTAMAGKCPDIGMAYGWFAVVKTPAFTAPSKTNIEATANSAIKARLANPTYNGATD